MQATPMPGHRAASVTPEARRPHDAPGLAQAQAAAPAAPAGRVHIPGERRGLPSFLSCCLPRPRAVQPVPTGTAAPPPAAVGAAVQAPATTSPAGTDGSAIAARRVIVLPQTEAQVRTLLMDLINAGRVEEATDLFIREVAGPQATPARLARLMGGLAQWERQARTELLAPTQRMADALQGGLCALLESQSGDAGRSRVVALFHAAIREPGFPLPPFFPQGLDLVGPVRIPAVWPAALQSLLPPKSGTPPREAKAGARPPQLPFHLPPLVESLLQVTGGAASVIEIGRAWVQSHEADSVRPEELSARFCQHIQSRAMEGADHAALGALAGMLAACLRADARLRRGKADALIHGWVIQGFRQMDPRTRKGLWPALLQACEWDPSLLEVLMHHVLQNAKGPEAQRMACVDLGFAIGSSDPTPAEKDFFTGVAWELGAAICRSGQIEPLEREQIERGFLEGYGAGRRPGASLWLWERGTDRDNPGARVDLVAMLGAFCRGPDAASHFVRDIALSQLPDSERLRMIQGFMSVAGARLDAVTLGDARRSLVDALEDLRRMGMPSGVTPEAAGDAGGFLGLALAAFYRGYSESLRPAATLLSGLRSRGGGARGVDGRAIGLGVLGSHLAGHITAIEQEAGWLARCLNLDAAPADEALTGLRDSVRAALGPASEWPQWFPLDPGALSQAPAAAEWPVNAPQPR